MRAFNPHDVCEYGHNHEEKQLPDHGEAAGRHQMFQKFTLYEGSVRVPFIVASLSDGPELAKGSEDSDHLISGVDLHATICDYAGFDPPEGSYRHSMRELAEGAAVPWREAAYIESTGIALNAYLERFNERHDELLQSKDPSTDYPEPVAATWDLSIQKVQDDCPNAVELLRLLSFLATDDIPRELIASAPEHLPKPLAETVSDPLEYDQAVRALRGCSLIDTQGGMFSIHRLVQMVIRDRLTEDEKKAWGEAAVSLLDDAFPYETNNVESWNACDPLLTHAQAAADHTENSKRHRRQPDIC